MTDYSLERFMRIAKQSRPRDTFELQRLLERFNEDESKTGVIIRPVNEIHDDDIVINDPVPTQAPVPAPAPEVIPSRGVKKWWSVYRQKKTQYPDEPSYVIRALTKNEILRRKPRLSRKEAENYRTNLFVTTNIIGEVETDKLNEVRSKQREEEGRHGEEVREKRVEHIGRMRQRIKRRRQNDEEAKPQPEIEFITENIIHGRPFNTTRITIENDDDYHITLEKIKPILKEVLIPIVRIQPIRLSFVYKTLWRFMEGGKDDGTPKSNDQVVYKVPPKHEPLITITREDDIEEQIEKYVNIIRYGAEHIELVGSGWVFIRSYYLDVKTADYNPLGSGYIDLAKGIKNTKACVNIKNDDDKCILWSLYAALYPVKKNAERVSNYKKYEEDEEYKDKKINTEGLTFPLQVKDIKKLEDQNNFGITVIRIGKKKGECRQEYISEKFKRDHSVNVIHIGRIENKDKQHYVWIKRLSALYDKKYHEASHICDLCLNHFRSKEARDKHFDDDMKNDPNYICMPEIEKDRIVKFRNYKNKMKCPFVVYADTEAIVVPKTKTVMKGIKEETEEYDEHQVCAYSFKVKSDYESLIEEYKKILELNKERTSQIEIDEGGIMYLYRGKDTEDTQRQLYEDLKEIQWTVRDAMKLNIKMEMTEDDKKDFQESNKCHICEQEFTEEQEIERSREEQDVIESLTKKEANKILNQQNKKVRDHDHYTGKYRGAAHYVCNINYNFKNFNLPIFFHNLKGYDEHFIIRAYAKYGYYYKKMVDKEGKPIIGEDGKQKTKKQELKIECIPNSNEKYLSFKVGNMEFKDTFGFMSFALEKLAEFLMLGGGETEFKQTRATFEPKYGNKWNMLLRKGVYPYEYMNSFEKFNETELPAIEAFYTKVKDEGIKQDDYEYAQKIWKEFGIKNMGEYTDLYLKTDVCLLTDIFEAFRNTAIKDNKLDPANYLTAPSLFNDQLYYKTKMEVENITDIDKLLMWENGKRGGNCTIGADRYLRANNKYMKEYDNTKPSVFTFYIDANALYAGCMTKPLPYGGIKWENDIDRFTEEYIKNIPEEGIKDGDNFRGYIFEIDGYYPNEVHEYLNDYTPLPENMANEASPYMKEAAEQMNIKSKPEVKLVCSLKAKTKYTVHYAELKSAIRHGFKLTKIHRVQSFLQKRWMEPYIMENINNRIKAKNEFEKTYYKLGNNAVYGKTMENVRTRREVKLTTNEGKKKALSNSAWFKDFKELKDESEERDNTGLFAIELSKKKIVMNKPIAVGISVLGWSKAHMFDMYYDIVKQKYGDKVRMHYTDTDSMFLSIQTEDLYEDMSKDLEFTNYFDLSTYPIDHPLFTRFENKEKLIAIKNTNKGLLGKFKDESAGKIIEELCFLRAKMYSYIIEGETKGIAKAKGISKAAAKMLTHEKYKNCLLKEDNESRLQESTFYRIASKDHQLRTIKQTKRSLSHYDDKRYYIDGIHSRAHGHYLNHREAAELK